MQVCTLHGMCATLYQVVHMESSITKQKQHLFVTSIVTLLDQTIFLSFTLYFACMLLWSHSPDKAAQLVQSRASHLQPPRWAVEAGAASLLRHLPERVDGAISSNIYAHPLCVKHYVQSVVEYTDW